MNDPTAKEIAIACRKLAVEMGAKSVIVLVSTEEKSAYSFHGWTEGLRGLLDKYTQRLLETIPITRNSSSVLASED